VPGIAQYLAIFSHDSHAYFVGGTLDAQRNEHLLFGGGHRGRNGWRASGSCPAMRSLGDQRRFEKVLCQALAK
jgi:hypothetical protein